MSNQGGWRGRVPLILAVAGTAAVAAGALGFARWNEAAADGSAEPAAYGHGIDREQAHELLDRFLDRVEAWGEGGEGFAMPGFGFGMPGAPGGMPFAPEDLERFGGMLHGGVLLGVTVDDALAVTAVLPGSPASEAGVQEGDRIVSVAGTPVADLDAVRAAIAAVEAGQTYPLVVERGGAQQTLQVTRPDVPSFDFEALMPWLEELERQMPGARPMDPQGGSGTGTGASGSSRY